MRFGKTLSNSIYTPWKINYIDYGKLKKLLRENEDGKTGGTWTEEDEGHFVEELVNVQLEKVNTFQVNTYKRLRERTSECERKLDGATESNGGNENASTNEQEGLQSVLAELDAITAEVNELEKYSRLNFTGFLKSAKKHDRRRGSKYKVRPLLQVRLAALPFNSEDYSPLLYRLSAMYSFVRERLHNESEKKPSTEDKSGVDTYKSHKFWVHPENILEVKTYILRRLPVLVYNSQTSKVADQGQSDPSITSLYFDNSGFSLYDGKVGKASSVSSLRLRWYGHLGERPEIQFEKKTIDENGNYVETRFAVKEKYIRSFINGECKLEKTVEKFRERHGNNENGVAELKNNIDEIQDFIKRNELQPILRANYTRTAFQIPGDARVRISLDTNVAFIREDSLDTDRPCRSAEAWHRDDIDDMEFPFASVRQGEVSRFPYALLDIKVRDGSTKRINDWVADLMNSHLVKEAPRFSKFVHGVAQLFDDYVNSFPFWLSDLETDIRREPEAAFNEEQEKKAKLAEDEQAVGSFLGGKSSSQFTAAVGSPVGKSVMANTGHLSGSDADADENDPNGESSRSASLTPGIVASIRSLFPSFSSSKYARAHQQVSVRLPLGVKVPDRLIKDSGPVRVEPKVWLANQRTFIKWQHIAVLLATLSLGLYNAAGEFNTIARSLAVVYTLVAIFAGAWGWWQYIIRSRMIQERSGKDFDNTIGPIIVCIGLTVGLCLNFGFKYRAFADRKDQARYIDQIYSSSELVIDDANVFSR